ncbi:MAG: hypothetical protein HEP71_29660 [Roseivirga sp.]|nr:hypothetical protein [Roseivirga sp.]
MTRQALLQLAEKSGTGYYFFEKSSLRQNIAEIREAFGVNLELCYSIKANYYPGILDEILYSGLSFDCASIMELEMLLQRQVPADHIWVNTPFLTDELLKFCADQDVMIVADSLEQLRLLAQTERIVHIGLRLNFPSLDSSRFGIALTDETLKELHGILKNAQCNLRMLHTHFSGTLRSAEAFGKRVSKLTQAYTESFSDYPIELLNVGGGLAGAMPVSLAAQFDYTIPTWREYARAAQPMGLSELPASVRLALEPGMALVSNTFGFLAEVMSMKEIAGRSIALLNTTNLFLKPSGHQKQLPFHVIKRSQSKERNHELVGISCMESDLLGHYEGSLSIGDLVAFENVGAYTQSYRPDFIFGAPDIIEV